jgi:DnaJ family protein B protein 12
VNKDEAARCRDIAAKALRQGQHDRAVKFFKKSLSMYPLPGVEAMLAEAEKVAANGGSKPAEETTTNDGASRPSRASTPTFQRSTSSVSATSDIGASGRAYTPEQLEIVKKILHAKDGGRGAHYRVLGISESATENEIKKAYRKRALKLHPDKNSAPHADDAFKAVGLAYGTLSDPQKRTIYDRYGDEDPDNTGGGMRQAGGGGGVHFRPGQDVSPEDIFNMFFGGGMPGGHMRGPGGVHFSSNFGQQQQRRQQQQRQQQQQQQQQRRGQGQRPQQPANQFQSLLQVVPFFLILILSFMNMGDDSGGSGGSSFSSGESRYFSLTVREIVYYAMQRNGSI